MATLQELQAEVTRRQSLPSLADLQAEQARRQAPQEEGFWSGLKESVTGSGRATEQTESLPELGEASGLLAGEDPAKAAGMSAALLTTTDPNEIVSMLTNSFPNIGVTYNKDAQGNTYPILVNNETGAATQINRPGLSALDVMQGIGLMAAFTPASRAASLTGAAVKSGLTETAIQSAQTASGGEFDLQDVVLSAGLGVAGKGLEEAVTTGARLIRGAPTGKVAEAVEFAEETRSPLMTTDVVPPRTFPGKAAQAGGEKIPFFGTGAQRADQQEARKKLSSEFAEIYIEFDPAEVYQSLQNQTNKIKQVAGSRRQAIVDKVAEVEIPESKAIQAIDDEINRLQYTPSGVEKKTADTATIQKLQAYKDDLISDPSFSALEKLRTDFRTNVKGDRLTMPDQSQAATTRIYSAMTKDMDDVVESTLGAEQRNRWKKANTIFAQEANKVKNTRLKGILDKGELTPEVVNSMLFSNKPSEFKALYNSLDFKGKQAAKSGLITKAWEASKDSPDRFLTNLEKLSKQTDIAFKGKDKRYIEGLKNYLAMTKEASQAEVRTKSGQELLQIAPVLAVGDIMTTGGLATISTAGYGLMARMYESQAIRNVVMRLAAAPKGSSSFDKLVMELQPLITAEMQALRSQDQEQEQE